MEPLGIKSIKIHINKMDSFRKTADGEHDITLCAANIPNDFENLNYQAFSLQ